MNYVYTSFDINFLINSFPETVKKDGAENLRVPGMEVSGIFSGRGWAILNWAVLFWNMCAQLQIHKKYFYLTSQSIKVIKTKI